MLGVVSARFTTVTYPTKRRCSDHPGRPNKSSSRARAYAEMDGVVAAETAEGVVVEEKTAATAVEVAPLGAVVEDIQVFGIKWHTSKYILLE